MEALRVINHDILLEQQRRKGLGKNRGEFRAAAKARVGKWESLYRLFGAEMSRKRHHATSNKNNSSAMTKAMVELV